MHYHIILVCTLKDLKLARHVITFLCYILYVASSCYIPLELSTSLGFYHHVKHNNLHSSSHVIVQSQQSISVREIYVHNNASCMSQRNFYHKVRMTVHAG